MSSPARKERAERHILATLEHFGPLAFSTLRRTLPKVKGPDRWVWDRLHALQAEGLIQEDDQHRWAATSSHSRVRTLLVT